MYQSAIAHKVREALVFPFVDLLFQDAQSHGLLDNFIIVGDVPLVHAALKQFRRVMATASWRKVRRGELHRRNYGWKESG